MTCDATRHIFNPHVLFGRPQGLFNSLKNILNIFEYQVDTFPIFWEFIININSTLKNVPQWKMLRHFCFGLTDPRYKPWLNVMDFLKLYTYNCDLFCFWLDYRAHESNSENYYNYIHYRHTLLLKIVWGQ